jgi:general secretion pathway protein D
MNAKKILGPSSVAFLALFAMLAWSEPPQAVLNVRQSGGMDLDLDLDSLEDDLAGDAADAAEAVGEAVEDVADAADEVVEDAADAADEVASDVDDLLADADAAADEAVEDVSDAADEAVADAADEVEDVADAAVEEVEDVADAAVEEVADAADDAVEEVEDVADAAVEEVEDVADAAVEEVEDAADDAVEEVEDVADAAVEEVADAADDAVEEVEDVADAAVEEVAADDDDMFDAVDEVAVDEVAVDDDAGAVDEVAVDDDVVADDGLDADLDAGLDADDDLIGLDADGGAVAAAAPADPMAKPISEIETLERARRELLINHGFDCIKVGKKMLEYGSWDRANEKFDEALRYLEPLDMETTHTAIEEARLGKGEAYYRLADDQVEARAYDDALANLRRARQYGHPKANERYNEVSKLQREPPPIPPPPVVPMWRDKDYVAMRERIDKSMKVAKEYYVCGLYTDCRREVELLLHEYPWCDEALNLLRRLAIREHQYVDEERRTTREIMVRDVTGKWTPRTYGVDFIKGDGDVKVTDQVDAAKVGGQDLSVETRIRQKMERIVIPEIEFRQANIADVISFLGDASREYDDENVAVNERGVNFVLDIGDVGGGDASSDDGFGGGIFDTPTEPAAASSGGVPLLTIKSHYVTLLSTLDLIMDMAGLKYRIQGNVVKIMPKNKADGTLIHRMYNVLPSIDQHVLSIGSTSEGSGSSDDPFRIGGGESQGTSDWKEFFGKLGVGWPDGSSVNYMPSIGKLVVMNTADNLATLEQVLGALNVTPFQVEIEVRFVEVGQTDLNALGLEWILNDDYEIAEMSSDAGLPAQSRRRLIMESGNVTKGFDYLSSNNRETINSGSPILDNIATFTSVLTNPQLSVVLHALANKTNADLLSAPKVVAQTGTEATIKSVVEYIYPTEFDVKWPESDGDNSIVLADGTRGGLLLPAVEPQNFQTREVGVILPVTPRVSSDGSRISLDLRPTIVSIPTWKDFGYTYPVDMRSGSGFHLTMEQPFFPVRALATSVDIYNGSTVVMGGMITEERYSVEDKIPIIGDIPILGRLFRYSYDQSEKKNLLIFVTARLVDPAGRKIEGAGQALVGEGNLH